ncbi:hypothetical protein J437_LFUL005233 [Ladona fulva]|uniref:Uncharacterized protein n=1 Tax=Ladona fulva TaxID=123851 RepID=A0A8K0KFG7_LADFU|nr:hypothetical protein J437_LFUL005233 [Ladona fulva]
MRNQSMWIRFLETDDNQVGMPHQSFVNVDGPIRSGFLFLMQLAWESRFRLPFLLFVGLMVLDVRMQLEIDIDGGIVNERRQRDNPPERRGGDGNGDIDIGDSEDEEYEVDEEDDVDDYETGDEDFSSHSDEYEVGPEDEIIFVSF